MHLLLLAPAVLFGIAWGMTSGPSITTVVLLMVLVGIGRALFGLEGRG